MQEQMVRCPAMRSKSLETIAWLPGALPDEEASPPGMWQEGRGAAPGALYHCPIFR